MTVLQRILVLAITFYSTLASAGANQKTHSVPLTLIGGETWTTNQKFWWASFDVGESRNLSLIVDTSSGTLILRNGSYKQSKEGTKLNFTSTAGFGCGNNENISVYTDTLSVGGLVVKNQAFGNFLPVEPSPSYPSEWGGDGIAGIGAGNFLNGHPGWFQNLCYQEQIEECRFGTALGTAGTGKLVLGGVDDSLFDGELTPIPFARSQTTFPKANVVINGMELLFPNRTASNFDLGSYNIEVPIADARKLFEHLGMQHGERTFTDQKCGKKELLGFYPCDQARTVGLQFLSETATSDKDTQGPVFNIEPEAFRYDSRGDNNCTAAIIGVEGGDTWFVSHPWMWGKYIDHGRWGLAQGVAVLKNLETAM